MVASSVPSASVKRRGEADAFRGTCMISRTTPSSTAIIDAANTAGNSHASWPIVALSIRVLAGAKNDVVAGQCSRTFKPDASTHDAAITVTIPALARIILFQDPDTERIVLSFNSFSVRAHGSAEYPRVSAPPRSEQHCCELLRVRAPGCLVRSVLLR